MTLRLGKTVIRVHLLLPVLWLSSFLLGSAAGIIGAMAALILHEAGHLIAAGCMRIQVWEIELSPIGGLMTLDQPEALPPARGFILAFAGPLFSLVGCYLSGLLGSLGISLAFCQALAQSSLLLCLLNLLPVLPLDGGCMIRALLYPHFSWQRVSRILTRMGYLVSAMLCALSLYFALQGKIVLSPMLAGLYLFYAAVCEERQAIGRYITSLIGRRRKLEDWQAIKAEILAVSGDMPVSRLPMQLRSGRYHIVQVLSPDSMNRLFELDERDICEMLMDHMNETVGESMKKGPSGNGPARLT